MTARRVNRSWNDAALREKARQEYANGIVIRSACDICGEFICEAPLGEAKPLFAEHALSHGVNVKQAAKGLARKRRQLGMRRPA